MRHDGLTHLCLTQSAFWQSLLQYLEVLHPPHLLNRKFSPSVSAELPQWWQRRRAESDEAESTSGKLSNIASNGTAFTSMGSVSVVTSAMSVVMSPRAAWRGQYLEGRGGERVFVGAPPDRPSSACSVCPVPLRSRPLVSASLLHSSLEVHLFTVVHGSIRSLSTTYVV